MSERGASTGSGRAASEPRRDTPWDPILLEIMKNEFGAVADEMAFGLRRTARSFTAREGGDFMVGILDRSGELIARSREAITTWYLPTVMPWLKPKHDSSWAPGDIIITNDPYGGGSHLNDVVLIMPIFSSGELVAFCGSAIHHADLGGRNTGGMSPTAREVYEEGLRLPALHLYRKGERNDALFELIGANTRAPWEVLGDLDAQVVACRRGEEGYLRLVAKHGLDTVLSYGQHLLDYAERQMRQGIANLIPGAWIAENQIDDDGVGTGPTPTIVQKIEIVDDTVTIDYTGTSPQVGTAINRPYGNTATYGNDIIRQVLDIDVPINSGVMRPVRIVAPEGSLVNPRFPAAVGARALTMSSGPLLAVLALAAPGRVPTGDSGPPGILVYTSRNDDGSSRVLFDLYQNGTGARPNGDGIDAGGRNEATGGLLETPAELIEREHPVIIEEFGFAPDTGGPGKYRGAVALRRRWRFLADGHVHMRNFHYRNAPYGTAGGRHGTLSRVTLQSGAELVELPHQSHIEVSVRAGDVLTHTMAGTGGYGDPWERDPDRVAADAADGKLTIDYCAREYGVVVDPLTFAVDEEQTARLRRDGPGPERPEPDPSVVVVAAPPAAATVTERAT